MRHLFEEYTVNYNISHEMYVYKVEKCPKLDLKARLRRGKYELRTRIHETMPVASFVLLEETLEIGIPTEDVFVGKRFFRGCKVEKGPLQTMRPKRKHSGFPSDIINEVDEHLSFTISRPPRPTEVLIVGGIFRRVAFKC
ncbi:unnamed protein product [Hymenolepis diminuta]|uniref:Uncharacterized protein n=1 Tax=Hymenolepis diminuta TaxID=6216 RepID=A0A564YE39_HYMDI|nr:unnamed protein product [Hymenolepis diminuta]VUZ44856.1 unnamed protein product [Hymenolepis diminuta]VUZ49116.1 unnamed protein product [Hymenolepis diminuta]VUZ49117.1 unnamed protein product [Hymenolepis diminuta]